MAFASVYTMGDVAMEMLHVCEDQKCMGTLAFFSFATYLKTELLTFLQSSMLWALLLSVETVEPDTLTLSTMVTRMCVCIAIVTSAESRKIPRMLELERACWGMGGLPCF